MRASPNALKVFGITGAVGYVRATVPIALAELNRSRLARGIAPAAARLNAKNLRVEGAVRINLSILSESWPAGGIYRCVHWVSPPTKLLPAPPLAAPSATADRLRRAQSLNRPGARPCLPLAYNPMPGLYGKARDR